MPSTYYGENVAPGESRTMLESYIGMAKRVRNMSDTAFFTEFGEVHRVTQHIKGLSANDAATQILALHKRHATEVGNVITKGIKDYAQDISDGKVPSTSLLILALPDEYKTPDTFADTPSTPVLVLDDIKDAETNRGLLARIVGYGRLAGVNKKLSARQLFFVSLLFRSNRTHGFAGQRITVVTEEEAFQELLKWRDNGYLKLSGKDLDKPAYRVQKMWGEFVRQIEKEKNLKNLFTNDHRDVVGQRFYGIHLRPNEKQILVTSIPSLFPKPTG